MKASSPSSILRSLLIAGLATLVLPACTTLPHFSEDNYVEAMDGAEVLENTTRYSKELECLRPYLQTTTKHRFAVGRVNDFTGKEDLTNGKRMTQGAALMVMSALGKAGVPIVERFDTSISDMELKYSDNKLITDEPASGNYRKIFGGSIPGSDYHIVGGITEVNYNIKSGSIDTSIKFLGAAAQYFVMNVGIDLRLVNTKTLEVVDVQSLQKQIIGTELRGGYFRIFNSGTLDLSAAERTQEPIQKATRMVIEQAVFNMLNNVYNLHASKCDALSDIKNQASNKTASTKPATATRTAAQATPAAAPVAPAAAVARPVAAVPSKTTQERIVIDTGTGGAAYGKEDPANQSPMNGLVGGTGDAAIEQKGEEITGKATTGSMADQANRPTNDRMKEKLLWGSRPQIQ